MAKALRGTPRGEAVLPHTRLRAQLVDSGPRVVMDILIHHLHFLVSLSEALEVSFRHLCLILEGRVGTSKTLPPALTQYSELSHS